MQYTYTEFPESTATTTGMKTIVGELENVGPFICKQPPVYATKDGVDLHLKLVYPETLDETKKYPLIVFVQGSGWKKQHLDNHIMDLYPIVKAGFVVAIVEYRHSGIAKFPAMVLDTKTAVRYLVEHQNEWPININQLFLAGDSSGGHTALCTFATWDDHRLDESNEPLPALKGCIDFYGPVDLVKMCLGEDGAEIGKADGLLGKALGGINVLDHQEIAYKSSPIYFFRQNQTLPPLMILHGSKDRQVPFEQSVLLYEHLKSLNINNISLYKVMGGDHGGNVFWSQPTIDVIVDFLNNSL